MTISDQAPALELLPARRRPVHRPDGRPKPRLVNVQLDPEALVFGGGRVRVKALLDRPDARPVRLWVRVAGRGYEVPINGCSAETEIELADVDWWWPSAHGEQRCYPIEVTLFGPDAEELDTTRRRIGFRWAQWAFEPDHSGNPCILIVNGRPVRVRGLDWTCEPASAPIAREMYARRLEAVRRSGVNLLRVRDGRFERDDFYDLCDRIGLLVWHDLDSRQAVEATAGQVAATSGIRNGLARVASHPAIVLVHLPEHAPIGLRRLVAEVAPHIPVAVEPPAPASWRGPDHRQPPFVTVLASPSDPAKAELGEALELAAGLIRARLRPEERAGVLIGRGSPAPGSAPAESGLLRQVVGKACADRHLVIAADRLGLGLTMLNDDTGVFAGPVLVRRLSYSGVELSRWETELLVWSHSSVTIRLPDSIAGPGDATAELLLAEVGGLRTAWFFCSASGGALEPPEWEVSITPGADPVRVHLTPNVLVRDACLLAPEGVEVEGGPVTLLPGETAEFLVYATIPAGELHRSLVPVCANDASRGESPQQLPSTSSDHS